MIRQIVIEAEPGDDSQRVFCLSINADVIARGVTAAQAYYLVGEVLRRIGFPEHAETVTFDADGGARESVRVPEAEAKAESYRLGKLTFKLFHHVFESDPVVGTPKLLLGLHASNFYCKLIQAYVALDWPRVGVLKHGVPPYLASRFNRTPARRRSSRWSCAINSHRANRTSKLDCALQIAVWVVCPPNACPNFNDQSRSGRLAWVALRNSVAGMHLSFPGA
jgi:hypothetical protein